MLALRTGKRMDLLGKNQNALPFFDLIALLTHMHTHASLQYCNQFKGMVNVRGKGEIFARLLAKIFRNAEMLILVDHIFLQK
jgi:hypothetical protein